MAAARGIANRIAALAREWRTRRRIARLLDLDDRMLADIGLVREDVHRALNGPLGRPAAACLATRRQHRIAAGRSRWIGERQRAG